MNSVIRRVKTYLKSDISGAVTPEWTVLTAVLVAMAASFAPIMVGVNLAAEVIESQVELPANGRSMDLSDAFTQSIH